LQVRSLVHDLISHQLLGFRRQAQRLSRLHPAGGPSC
jgi:hypothetical protein